jgi:hypothetical protein
MSLTAPHLAPSPLRLVRRPVRCSFSVRGSPACPQKPWRRRATCLRPFLPAPNLQSLISNCFLFFDFRTLCLINTSIARPQLLSFLVLPHSCHKTGGCHSSPQPKIAFHSSQILRSRRIVSALCVRPAPASICELFSVGSAPLASSNLLPASSLGSPASSPKPLALCFSLPASRSNSLRICTEHPRKDANPERASRAEGSQSQPLSSATSLLRNLACKPLRICTEHPMNDANPERAQRVEGSHPDVPYAPRTHSNFIHNPFRMNTSKSVTKQTTLSCLESTLTQKQGGGGSHRSFSLHFPFSNFYPQLSTSRHALRYHGALFRAPA